MKFKEEIRMSASDVRQICINHRWYTAGDNRAYSNMFNRIYSVEGSYSQELLEFVANDIVDHTPESHEERDGNSREDFLLNVMYILRNHCCTSFFKEED